MGVKALERNDQEPFRIVKKTNMMKHLLLTLLLFPLVSFSQVNVEAQFVGKWLGEDKKEIGTIVFDEEGYAYFEISGQIIGGKEFTMEGKKGSMAYYINSNTEPIQVDLVITKLESKEQISLLGIAKFTDEYNMILALNFDNTRPSEFTEDNSIELHKVE